MKQGIALQRELKRLIRAEESCQRRGETAMARLVNARRAQLEVENLPILAVIRESLARGERIWV